jgi:DNA polymerase-1
MGKLLAIDGLHIVRRVYAANPDPDSPAKAQTAIRNSLLSISKLLATHEPTHAFVAFDGEGRYWRHDIYGHYHENHPALPARLQQQMPEFYDLLARRHLKVLSLPGVEADDVIGTAVMRWLTEEKGEAVVASTDRSLHVLIEHGARVWDHFKGEWHDRKWVEEKYGVPPEMLADLLALVGDSTRGVPGVSKVGAKTAARLLHSYKTLEGIMAGAGILKDSLGEKLRQDRDQVFLSRDLVKLKTDVRLGVTWKGLAYLPR